jgi:hypothetical protein
VHFDKSKAAGYRRFRGLGSARPFNGKILRRRITSTAERGAAIMQIAKKIQPAFMIVLPKEHPMDYRQLGRTDLNVSAICLGTMTWGEQNSEAEAFAQIERAKAGINFIDTAEMYPVRQGRNLRHHRTLHR